MSAAGVLIVESSTTHASIAIVMGDGSLVQREFCSDRHHNALLFEPLSEFLHDSPDKIGLVLVGSGPGSYSGTRVGIAAAQGVAIALQCPAVAIPSILAVPSAEQGRSCLTVGDARRGSYWTAMMKNSALINDPALCDAESLNRIVADAIDQETPIIAFEEPDRFEIEAHHREKIHVEFPNAARLWQAWLASDDATRQRWIAAIPQPIYLKPPHITPGKRPRLV
jgi:tRNA threonylcarbamoyl adenosine modification protein YeaZ